MGRRGNRERTGHIWERLLRYLPADPTFSGRAVTACVREVGQKKAGDQDRSLEYHAGKLGPVFCTQEGRRGKNAIKRCEAVELQEQMCFNQFNQ